MQASPLHAPTATVPLDGIPSEPTTVRRDVIDEPPTAPTAATVRCTPRLRLYTEPLLVDDQQGEREVELPVLELVFDYGGTLVGLRDESDVVCVASSGGTLRTRRDLAFEGQAQRLLERHGAVELECVDGMEPPIDSDATHVVHPEGNVHAACSFTAHALAELRQLGWHVDIDPDYPYQVVAPDSGWYGHLEAKDENEDWFSLELGIEVGGERINLVPALIELIEQTPDGASLDALAHCPARYRAVPVGAGRYLAVPWERLERVLKVLRELYVPGGDNQHFDFLGALVRGLGQLHDALSEGERPVDWQGREDVVRRGRSLWSGPSWSPQPAALKATLRDYQHEGLNWLTFLRDNGVGGVLADDMGLGKTLQTIALLAREKEGRRAEHPSLVVAPTSLAFNWQRELRKFAPYLRTTAYHGKKRRSLLKSFSQSDVVITTYPVLVRDRDTLCDRDYHYVILDEAQAIKNPRSQASHAVRDLRSRHRLCLSGTPVENNLEELWSLFDFLMPGFLGSAEQFRRRFRTPIETGGQEHALEALRDRVRPFVLRRLKESVARELPPKTELVRGVELSGDQRDLYESIRVAVHSEVRQAIRKRGFGAASVTILDALMKLRQACCDPRLVSVESAREVERSAKLELFLELVQRQLEQGRRVLVFSQFARMLSLLGLELSQRSIEFLLLTGKTSDRRQVVDAFEGGRANVFLISLKAGGTGLNLTSADTVIHYDPWWNAAAQMQATDRAYRIGQTKPVFVYNLIVTGSVEERMLRLQQRKRYLADALLGTHTGSVAGLMPSDVEDLLAPLEDD